jgi:hypothetical protein
VDVEYEAKGRLITVQGYQMEKKISIPIKQHSHFENHLSFLQDTGSDDDHMEYESFIELCNVCGNFMKNSTIFVHHCYIEDGGLFSSYTAMYMK